MDRLLVSSMLASFFLLWAKFLWAISLQALHRMRSKQFQYPEDAKHWSGTPDEAALDLNTVKRAQNMLRNDGESQPYFFVLAILYTWLGCLPKLGAVLFMAYAIARWLHGIFLINPKQPQRNFAFSTSLVIQLVLVGVLVHHAVAKMT